MQVSRWTYCFILSLCLFALGCSGPPICLNGVIEGTEVCDDGNLLNGDGCDENCTSTGCGNGILTSPEVCDDGNLTNGDGCASSCAIEPGFACLGTPSVCALLCGNGLLNQGEICDDGNLLNLDGCASNCTLEEGFTCLGEPTVCAPICGDGLVRGDEPCDDGNATQNDGCDPDCSTSRAVQVSSGRTFTCVLLTGGDVRCWGQGIQGQLGYPGSFLIQGNSVGDDEIPSIMGNVDVGGVVTQLDAGGIHACALLNTGAVRCWGDGSVGALGYGNTNSIGDNETPASAGDLRLFSSVERLESGGGFTCALGKLSDAGTVRCWGFGIFGRLGYGNTENIGDDEDLGQPHQNKRR
jgi:cysteine-rich repeat protein